jgi:hypothetical protein
VASACVCECECQISRCRRSVANGCFSLFLAWEPYTEQHPFIIAEYSYGLEACFALPARLVVHARQPQLYDTLFMPSSYYVIRLCLTHVHLRVRLSAS